MLGKVSIFFFQQFFFFLFWQEKIILWLFDVMSNSFSNDNDFWRRHWVLKLICGVRWFNNHYMGFGGLSLTVIGVLEFLAETGIWSSVALTARRRSVEVLISNVGHFSIHVWYHYHPPVLTPLCIIKKPTDLRKVLLHDSFVDASLEIDE